MADFREKHWRAHIEGTNAHLKRQGAGKARHIRPIKVKVQVMMVAVLHDIRFLAAVIDMRPWEGVVQGVVSA